MFLALKVAIASKLLVERYRSAWQKSITFFTAHFAESSLRGELVAGRARLSTADRGAESQLQLTELKEQRVAQRGRRVQARKSELENSPGPAILLDMNYREAISFFAN